MWPLLSSTLISCKQYTSHSQRFWEQLNSIDLGCVLMLSAAVAELCAMVLVPTEPAPRRLLLFYLFVSFCHN